MKKCFKCGLEKEISEFYKHKQMADGYLGKCKECAKKDVHIHRNKNLEQIQEYDRQRSKLPHRKKRLVRSSRKYKKLYPTRYAANYLLCNAVRDKRITKATQCENCGGTKSIVGHHIDYYKPLEVVWLCQSCHVKLHQNIILAL